MTAKIDPRPYDSARRRETYEKWTAERDRKRELAAKKAERRKCRVCGGDLLMHAEGLLGVHIGCVANNKFNKKTIRVPSYGSRRKSDS